jgi:hypothetical protein
VLEHSLYEGKERREMGKRLSGLRETSEKQIPAKKIQSAEVQDNCYVRLAREEEP